MQRRTKLALFRTTESMKKAAKAEKDQKWVRKSSNETVPYADEQRMTLPSTTTAKICRRRCGKAWDPMSAQRAVMVPEVERRARGEGSRPRLRPRVRRTESIAA